MLLQASNASRSGQGTLEGVPSISSMDAERFGMASRPLQRYAFAGERVQLALQRLLQRYRPPAGPAADIPVEILSAGLCQEPTHAPQQTPSYSITLWACASS